MFSDFSPDFEQYLVPTELCDCSNPVIVNKANELIGQSVAPKEAAKKIFRFVRDEIPFEATRAEEKASETLQRGSGFCITKSNLQVALLRAIGIPARYHHVHLRKGILKGIIPEIGYDTIDEVITYHPWCECYLGSEWIACEALFQKELVPDLITRGYITNSQIPSINWDGRSDLVICTHWIVKDEGVVSNMDEVFRQAQKKDFQ